MTNLLGIVQPAKPGSGDRAYSGLHGVWYTDRQAEEGSRPLKVFFATTLHVIVNDKYEPLDPEIQTTYVEAVMQRWINWHKEGIIQLDPLSIWHDPADQRPPNEQRQQSAPPANSGQSVGDESATPPSTPGMFVNHGYKIKRMVDEGKVSYVIAFKMANGKESDFPATISNEKYLKMLAKALAEAGYKSAEWASGEPHLINIEFGVTKSKKVAANGKKFNNYEYFKVVADESSGAQPF